MKVIRTDGAFRIATIAGFAALACVAGCDRLVTTPSLYGTVNVTVRQRSGAPVNGASLLLYSGVRPITYAETDRHGSYAFHDVPEGAYGVRIAAPAGYVRLEDLAGGAPSDVKDKLEIRPGDSVDVQFTLLKAGFGVVVAEVTAADGSPMAMVPVSLYRSTGALRSGVSDVAGRFVFDSVPTGGYGVSIVRGPAFSDTGEPGIAFKDGIFVDDGSREVVKFQLLRCVGALSVTVRDEQGTPVPGSVVTAYSSSMVVDEARTSADGSHVFGVPCGAYGVRVRPAVGWTVVEGRGTSFNDGLVVHRGAIASTTLTVQTVSTRATLRARVTDETGAPVAGARITLYTFDGTYREVVTASDGQAIIDGIPCDRLYGVRVDPPTGYSVIEGRGSSFVDGLSFTNGQVFDVAFRVAHH